MSEILVTGGAGYIGSFICRALKEKGFDVVIVDDLSSGHEKAVEGFKLHKLNLVSEREALKQVFKEHKFDGVVHMAAFIQMGESFKNPLKYFNNNLVSAINLLDVMNESGVKNIVFSSSAGVYGNPEKLPITEESLRNPLNPYGETKYMVERMLSWMKKSHGMDFASIRYFNAAGASLDGSIGEDHPDESHLIPLAIKAAMEDREFVIYGDDYDTPDGTNVRDYIHVLDLADTHVLALEALLSGKSGGFYNAGVGRGYSNNEVMAMIEEVSGKKMKIKYGQRREGDADSLYASVEKIKNDLSWEPKYGLKEIIESAYKWHTQNPDGYKDNG